MTTLLLTGAGFTHNWGGWRASEVFEYLVGCAEIDAALRSELWNDKNLKRGLGYEDTMARLEKRARVHGDATAAKQFATLTTALVGMFNFMDRALESVKFEFVQDRKYHVTEFLARFDAIFTLNQDLLLEHHYARGAELAGTRRWIGFTSPGIGAPSPASGLNVNASRTPLAASEFKVQDFIQPYFKLHGSQNWKSEHGEPMLIAGGNKSTLIEAHPLLKWFAAEFERRLSEPNARLMIIGYGFSDEHINAAVQKACHSGLKVFLIDPAGTDVIDRRVYEIDRLNHTDLMRAVQPQIIGESRRPLATTFGSDVVEHAKVMRFFGAEAAPSR